MLESTGKGSLSIYLLKALILFSSERGVNTGAILRAINFDENLLSDEQSRVPLTVLNELWNNIEEATKDPFLGLHFGEAFGKHGGGHFLLTIMKNSENLHKAIQSLIRFHGLMTDIVKLSLTINNGKACLKLENQFQDAVIARHLSDTVMSLLVTNLKKITNHEIVFEKVYFTHSSTDNSEEYTRIFGKKSFFTSDKNCIVFDASELTRTFPLAQHEFGSHLRGYAEKMENQLFKAKKLNERISVLLEKKIMDGEDFSLKSVSDAFNMSMRHLQNKLKDEEVTFQVLLDRARKEIALHYLQNEEVMLCDIAFLLGFSEQSSFNHAFKKWTGLTPGAYKKIYIVPSPQ
jgi:AraC-like DNA-binding protein